ncbi:hypothetical protein TNCV_4219831 [Trichonephila clavipes]|nr:hypothetical protein TNCV_4219831 [Trichonephila clavipes]
MPDPGWNPLHLVDGARDDTKETVRSKGLQATTSYPGSCTGQDKQKTFGTTARAFSKKKRVVITPVIRPPVAPVLIIKPSTALATPQPVSIPEPLEQTTPQILLPDPPPELTTSQILLPDPPSKQTTPQFFLPDPPEQTTSQILLPDPPVVETTSHRSFYQIHHLSRQHLRSSYQIHLWSRLWSRPLRMTLS